MVCIRRQLWVFCMLPKKYEQKTKSCAITYAELPSDCKQPQLCTCCGWRCADIFLWMVRNLLLAPIICSEEIPRCSGLMRSLLKCLMACMHTFLLCTCIIGGTCPSRGLATGSLGRFARWTRRCTPRAHRGSQWTRTLEGHIYTGQSAVICTVDFVNWQPIS